MDIILYGKKGHTLSAVKRDFNAGLISQETASKRIFPLLVIRGNNKGVTRVKGSEPYIRELYRKRWSIEIAFRTIHRIRIENCAHCRDIRVLDFGSKCFIYAQSIANFSCYSINAGFLCRGVNFRRVLRSFKVESFLIVFEGCLVVIILDILVGRW